MNMKTHVIGGVSAGVIANELFIQNATSSGDVASNILISSVFVAGSVLGSLVPDIDHKNSYIGRRFKLASLTVRLFTGHRGLTHTLIFLMAIVGGLLFLSNTFLSGFSYYVITYMTLGLGVGIASHLLLDAMTKQGVPLLFPISVKNFSFLPIRTGGFLEMVVAFGIAVGTLLFIVGRHLT